MFLLEIRTLCLDSLDIAANMLSSLDTAISSAQFEDYVFCVIATVFLQVAGARVKFLGIYGKWYHISTEQLS